MVSPEHLGLLVELFAGKVVGCYLIEYCPLGWPESSQDNLIQLKAELVFAGSSRVLVGWREPRRLMPILEVMLGKFSYQADRILNEKT